ncbi:uncharacterized protein LOC100903982 [Galendromus occidentalis]|uniref:Uncharacterized protein LOC100903982 n=1 Tax=Galendromus occidentalis TaxID=34638 RepID=A0AAJ6QQF0_9ACAR|nr:uncharacterized protein LOC100903982 [Galendromus occidentalis]
MNQEISPRRAQMKGESPEHRKRAQKRTENWMAQCCRGMSLARIGKIALLLCGLIFTWRTSILMAQGQQTAAEDFCAELSRATNFFGEFNEASAEAEAIEHIKALSKEFAALADILNLTVHRT